METYLLRRIEQLEQRVERLSKLLDHSTSRVAEMMTAPSYPLLEEIARALLEDARAELDQLIRTEFGDLPKAFAGIRQADTTPGGQEVLVRVGDYAYRLPQRGSISTGFEWGYGGGGPSHLAYNILLEVFGNQAISGSDDALVATRFEPMFMHEVIAKLPRYAGTSWTLTEDEVRSWVAGHGGPTS